MDSNAPRAYTDEEVRAMFLKHVWTLISYWGKLEGKSKQEALEGLAFSILSGLDGSTLVLPGFLVIPNPHPDDQEYNQKQGENWFPPFVVGDEEPCDIGGSLHELFHEAGRKYAESGSK